MHAVVLHNPSHVGPQFRLELFANHPSAFLGTEHDVHMMADPGIRHVPSLRDSDSLSTLPALPCRATDCNVPSGLDHGVNKSDGYSRNYFGESRCVTLTRYPGLARRFFTSSAIITERCCPPVQPKPMVR